MTRWLDAVHEAVSAENLPKQPKQPLSTGVNSVNSVNSDDQKLLSLSAEELVRDLYEERAAIRQFDGGQSRTEAETGALADVAKTTGLPAYILLKLLKEQMS